MQYKNFWENFVIGKRFLYLIRTCSGTLPCVPNVSSNIGSIFQLNVERPTVGLTSSNTNVRSSPLIIDYLYNGHMMCSMLSALDALCDTGFTNMFLKKRDHFVDSVTYYIILLKQSG